MSKIQLIPCNRKSVSKRLRYFKQRDGATLNMALRILLRVIAQAPQANSPGAQNPDKAALHICAIAFIHRFGSRINEHVHFYVCAVDGVFEEAPDEGDADAVSQTSPPRIVLHAATAVDADVVTHVQSRGQQRFCQRGGAGLRPAPQRGEACRKSSAF